MKVRLRRQGCRFSYLIVLAPVVLCLFTAISAFAQLSTGTILGVVKDASGAVVPDSTVTVRNLDTNITRATPTETDGSYRFPALPAGSYEIEASHTGFATVKESGITLSVGQEAVQNITLSVGATSQTVEVTAVAPLVNTTNGTIGGVVNEQKVQDLPLNGRNYQDLNLLQPGISRIEVGSNTGAGGGGDVFSSNGAPIRSNLYLLDGASMSNDFGTATSSVANTTLGVDGIKEFRTVTNAFDAEYGLVMGSVMTIVTKNGTNQFHGDGFEYLRNSAMDAANFFDPTSIDFPGKRIAALRRNQFGGSIGGPIRKDKTFFFATYEGLRQVSGTPDISSTFALNCYSSTTHLVLVTGNPCATGSKTAGAAPAGTAAAVVVPFLQFFQYPNLPPAPGSTTPRYGVVFASPVDENYGQGRIDHHFSDKDSFFTRYTIDDTHNIIAATNPLFQTPNTSRYQFVTLSETHIFSPTLLNTVQFSVSISPIHQYSNTPGQSYVCPTTGYACVSNNPIPGTSLVCSTAYGAVTNTATGPTGPGCIQMGSISISGGGPTGPSQAGDSVLTMNTFSTSDDVFYTKGKHAFKFGALINHYQSNNLETIGQGGTLTFANVANFFAGLATSYSLVDPAHHNGFRYYRYNSFGFYTQDDIRLTPRLTVNLGLRYEFDTVPTEKYGLSDSFRHISTTDTINSVVFGPMYTNPSFHNFSPRVGFAWDIFGNGKTALRGGFGELYDIGNIGSALVQQAIGEPPFNQAFSFTAPTGTTALIQQLPLTNLITPGYLPAVHVIDYYQRQPHLLQYNLSIQRQLPWELALTVSYAGSRGLDLWQEEQQNPHAPIPGTVNEWPLTGNTLFTGTLFENPNLGTAAVFTTRGSSYYNSLQVNVIKQIGHMQFQSAYTYSHDIDNQQAQLGSEGANSDPLDTAVDRGPANWDVRHQWRFNAIYTLPDVTHEKYLGAVVNGWRISGIETLTAGYPFSPTMSTNTSGSGVGTVDRPNFNPAFTGVLYPHTFGEWFNPAAFIAPPNVQTATGPAGVLGNMGRNSLRGPGLSNLDFSLAKQAKIKQLGEGGGLEFRVDSFNIWNHPNFGSPAASAAYNGTTVGTGTAGQISATAPGTDSRRMQLSLKLLF